MTPKRIIKYCALGGLLLLSTLGAVRFIQYEMHLNNERMKQQRIDGQIQRICDGQDFAVVTDSQFLQQLAESNCVGNVTNLLLEPYAGLDHEYRTLSKLTNVTEVGCSYFVLTPKAAQYLKTMPSVEKLTFHNMRISEGSLEVLAEIEQLEAIEFSWATLSRSELTEFNERRSDIAVVEVDCNYTD